MDTLDNRLTLFIEVLLPINLQNTFTYRVPHELNEEIVVGKRVSVPFGRNKVLAGLIYSIGEKPPTTYQAKYLIDVLDNEPIVLESQLKFWSWISKYYMASLGLIYNAALPAGLKMEGESKMILHPEFDFGSQTYDNKEIIIIDSLRNSVEMTISQAQSLLKTKQIYKLIKSLYLKGAILLKDDLNDTYKPKMVNYISIHQDVQGDTELNVLFDELERRAKKQLKALMTFIAEYSITGEAEKTELVKHDLTNAAVNALINKGVFVQENRVKSRIQFSEGSKQIECLEVAQQEALSQIKSAFLENKPALLYGVTSSGKTHIYAHLIQEFLEQNKQVLYLLPEIALTSQLISRLEQYFGDKLVVSHSRFGRNERVEVYQSIKRGNPLLIVGTRSAIFQPFQNLGLVIVDEEHESSFKQHEPAPRFHARDAALYLASKQNANILLGSATPAVESYYNANHNKYKLVKLTKRFQQAILPKIEVLDMHVSRKQKKVRGIFSDILLEAISNAKKNGKQVILFQNKKGYVPVLECNVCAWTPKCQNCDISLTYYKYQDNLRCHYCGYTHEVVSQCSTCGNKGIELIGYGTERIEDELELYLPDIRVKRMDYNTTRLKNAHTKLIQQFANGEIDVLIGTQMIAKGLDFENVSTVGILNADHLINFPDFRANERAFQLITQVAGRAGRRREQGTVYIQTSKPDHLVIKQIVENNYQAMYEGELAERKDYNYPPFYRLVKVTLKHKDALELYKIGQTTKNHLITFFGNSLLGPEKPYVSKIRNWYLLHFVLKIENNAMEISKQKFKLANAVAQLNKKREFNQARIIIDVDPL